MTARLRALSLRSLSIALAFPAALCLPSRVEAQGCAALGLGANGQEIHAALTKALKRGFRHPVCGFKEDTVDLPPTR